jgi:hypothetical protein
MPELQSNKRYQHLFLLFTGLFAASLFYPQLSQAGPTTYFDNVWTGSQMEIPNCEPLIEDQGLASFVKYATGQYGTTATSGANTAGCAGIEPVPWTTADNYLSYPEVNYTYPYTITYTYYDGPTGTGNIIGYTDITFIASSTASSSGVTSTTTIGSRTEVISSDPSIGQVLATTTGYSVEVNYYITEDDFCDSIFCDTYIDVFVKEPLNNNVSHFIKKLDSNLYSWGFDTIYHFFDSISATGTYALGVRIYNDYPLGIESDKLYTVWKFHVGSENTDQEIQAWASSSREMLWETQDYIEAGSEDIGTSDEPGIIASLFRDTVYDFLRLPPWGYVTVFLSTFQNGTSTELGTLTMSFPTSSPMHGTELDLDIDEGFATAIQTIRDDGVTGEYGDSFDTFLYWWELFWLMLFVIWLIKEVLGFFDFSLTRTSVPNDVNMRAESAPRSGTIPVKRG